MDLNATAAAAATGLDMLSYLHGPWINTFSDGIFTQIPTTLILELDRNSSQGSQV